MVYPIVTGAETEILLQKAAKVKDFNTPEMTQLIADMFESMKVAEGMGLAAPQIGISKRLAIIEWEGMRHVLINPKITSFSQDKVLFEEGCLSLPQQFFWIERSQSVTVRFQDEQGNDVKMKASGILAIAIQHEVDHLEGTLIVNRFKSQKVSPGTPVWK